MKKLNSLVLASTFIAAISTFAQEKNEDKIHPNLRVQPIDFTSFDNQVKKIEDFTKNLNSKKPNIEKVSGNGLRACYPDYKDAYGKFKSANVAYLESVVKASESVKQASVDGLKKINDQAKAFSLDLQSKDAEINAQKENIKNYPDNKEIFEKGLTKLQKEYDEQLASNKKTIDAQYKSLKENLVDLYTDKVVSLMNVRAPVKAKDEKRLVDRRKFNRKRVWFNMGRPLFFATGTAALAVDYLTPIGWIGGFFKWDVSEGYELFPVMPSQGKHGGLYAMTFQNYAEWKCSEASHEMGSGSSPNWGCVEEKLKNKKQLKSEIGARIFANCKTSTCVWQLAEDMKSFVKNTKNLAPGLDVGEDIHLKGRKRKDKRQDNEFNDLLSECAEQYAQKLPVAKFTNTGKLSCEEYEEIVTMEPMKIKPIKEIPLPARTEEVQLKTVEVPVAPINTVKDLKTKKKIKSVK